MEMLNYSLWFTLMWWVTRTWLLFSNIDQLKKNEKVVTLITTIIYLVFPATAILLEYLIVR